jgi:hypothetical protein
MGRIKSHFFLKWTRIQNECLLGVIGEIDSFGCSRNGILFVSSEINNIYFMVMI